MRAQWNGARNPCKKLHGSRCRAGRFPQGIRGRDGTADRDRGFDRVAARLRVSRDRVVAQLRVERLDHRGELPRFDGERKHARERITAAYPGYPRPAACVQLGGDFAFGTAAWQIAEAHGQHAPTYVYRYDYAPRTLHWSGLGATHATELLAVFDIYRTRFGAALTAAMDRRSALKVSRDLQNRWRHFSRTGVPGEGWPRYNEAERPVLVFDRHTRVDYDPHPHRREAWAGFSLAGR